MTSFPPIDSVMLANCFTLYSKVMTLMLGLVSIVFVLRISLLLAKVAGPGEYGEVIQDTVAFLGLNFLFPKIVNLIVSSISNLSQQIAFIPIENSKNAYIDFVTNVFSTNGLLTVLGKLGPLIIQGLSFSVYSILISLLLASAPIFMFLGTMFGMANGIKTYFGIIVCLCLWPVLWNLLGQLGNSLSSMHSESPLISCCFYFTIILLQLFSPLISFSLFKSMSVGGGTIVKTATKLVTIGSI